VPRRPRTKRLPPAKKLQRKVRVLFYAAAFALAALTAALAAVFLYADRSIAPLLDSDWKGKYTTRIHSAPFAIRVRDPLSAWELEKRLSRLRYLPADAPAGPGEFSRQEDLFDIHLRGFEHPFKPAAPVRVEVSLAGGRVTGLRLSGTKAPLVEAVLEPELLYEVSGDRRVRRSPLAAEDIPPALPQALVAVEDRRYYAHPGLDPRGIARAAWRNLRAGRVAEGGSTLTQQLAKNLFLSPKRTFSRKMKEALCALYLEARFSKAEILRIYLDSVYFGQDGPTAIIGLTAAARYFFDKSTRDLSLEESAFLAGVVRSPRRYDPFRYPAEARARRDTVLEAMREEGFIGTERAKEAARLPLHATRKGHGPPKAADYFLAHLQRVIETRYSDQAWMTRGMTIYTTADPWVQERATRAVQSSRHQAALAALDPRTGAIRALVGGKDFSESPFNRATQARRQPGSAFKPFVYGAALHRDESSWKKWTPASLLDDATRSFRIEGGEWVPRNYDRKYRGPVPLRTALALSLNAATVNLTDELGPARVIRYARELGIMSPLRPELGLALGAFEVSLLELTGAYCTFANGGFRVEPYGIEAVLDAEGEVVEYHAVSPRPVLSPGEAYLMTDLLREVVRTGTARALARWGLEGISAGKTGTTNAGRDAWFVGCTPRIVAGVWAGSDTPAPLGLTGSGAALPVWARFIRSTEPPGDRETESDPWPRPESVITLRIDPASGLRARLGCPKTRTEIFLKDGAPVEECPLHAGGVSGWVQRFFRRWKKPHPELR